MKVFGLTLLASLSACTLLPHDNNAEIAAMMRKSEIDATERQRQQDAKSTASASEAMAAYEGRQKEDRAKAEAEERAREESFRQKRAVETWKQSWSAECARALNYGVCSAAPKLATGEDKAKCGVECQVAMQQAAQGLLEAALAGCVSAEGPAVCRIALPAGAADGKGVPLSTTFLPIAETDCAKACIEGRAEAAVAGREQPKAEQSGEGLVLSYKRCMLAVGSTRQAITYKIHDTDLYQDLMAKTDTRCRSANRCDWVEKYSDWRCSYGD